ncbi:MAG: nodulation protein NfeD [Dysgonamonadaceae bacterium]|jgi:membrane-bound serine protease (ClpP class)|nr:nodulation protein NfeD [Dysgonamonadaceae bacterium]
MKKIISVFSLLLVFCNLVAEDGNALVYKININSEINTTSRLYLQKGLKEAKTMNADAVLLHLNTYGGAVVDADSMRSAILYSPIPVSVFIDNNAASAGALIAIACKNIYMREGANIGAATVVSGQTGEAMPDKYQSYMRSIIRSTAEAHGKKTEIIDGDTIEKWIRDPQIAEAMVDERIFVPNVIDSGKVLTLTANEAVKLGFCEGIAETESEVIQKMGYTNYTTAEFRPSFADTLKGFLMNPAFQAVLIMIIVAGIYFELQTPGIGFPTLAAVIAAVLYFTPLYIDGLVQNWEIVIFIIGIGLLLVEIFVIPGFGITGVSGIICIAAGLIFALLDNDLFTFREVRTPNISRSILTVVSGMFLGFALILWLSSRIGEKGMFRKIALTADLENAASEDPAGHLLAGKTGRAATVLRPAGKVVIDNELYDAVSNFGYIESGAEVRVVKFENMQIYVEKI